MLNEIEKMVNNGNKIVIQNNIKSTKKSRLYNIKIINEYTNRVHEVDIYTINRLNDAIRLLKTKISLENNIEE